MTPGVPTLSMWVVYDHPLDDPDRFMARRWVIEGGRVEPTDDTFADKDLAAVRGHLMDVRGVSVALARNPDDDPVIVETWI